MDDRNAQYQDRNGTFLIEGVYYPTNMGERCELRRVYRKFGNRTAIVRWLNGN